MSTAPVPARLPLPPVLVATALRQEGLVSARQCEAAGVGRERRASLVRSRRALLVQRGVLDLVPSLSRSSAPPPGATPDGARRRAAWLALLAVGPAAIAVGACALALLGVEGLPRTIAPEAALPGGSHRRPRGSVVVRSLDQGMRPVHVGGARVAPPACALAQALCALDRRHAVAVLDSALQRRLLPDGLDPVEALLRGRRGGAAAREWLRLADGSAQSPLETWARLDCVDGGVPPDALQVPVRDERGRIVARGDMGWWRADGRLLVVEVDGAGPHASPEALYADRLRQNAIVATGRVDVLRFTAADVARSGVVAAAVRRHLAVPAPPLTTRHANPEFVSTGRIWS